MFRRGKLAFLSTKDDRIKIINERINMTEKHLIEMCSSFALCTRKMAKYRDSYDELAKGFKNYADDEEINESLSEGLKSFTNAVTILGDYMDVQVQRMEAKVVNELAMFESLCKSTRDNLRTAVLARDKEVLKQRQMLEIKAKFSANNTAADSELLKAKLEVNRTNREIDDIISNFEKRKLGDIKTILGDFVLICMKQHSKALEALSASYYDISNIDERSDFMEFQKLMKPKEDASTRKLLLKKALRSQSMECLDRDKLGLCSDKRRHRLTRSTKNLAGKHDDEKDLENEDDDDDDDDDDEDDDDEEADSDDHSQPEEDDSGSASDDELDKRDFKKIKSKFQAKPTPHVVQTQLLPAQRRPFAARASGGGIGIPSSPKTPPSEEVETRGSGRLVTLVESKKTKQKRSPEYADDVAAAVIDCSRGGRK